MVLGQKMIELLSKTNRISQRGLIWSFLVIWALGVAIFWPGEEPAKVNTLLVVGIVFVLAYLIIAYAAKSKIITSKIYWMVAFLVMMTLVAIPLTWDCARNGQATLALTGLMLDEKKCREMGIKALSRAEKLALCGVT